MVHLGRIPALKVGTSATPDQKAIASKGHFFSLQDKRKAALGVAGGRPDHEGILAKFNFVAMAKGPV
jgi:hypothetical protein